MHLIFLMKEYFSKLNKTAYNNMILSFLLTIFKFKKTAFCGIFSAECFNKPSFDLFNNLIDLSIDFFNLVNFFFLTF